MNAATVIDKMRSAGLTVSTDGRDLIITPPGQLTDRQRDFLKRHKAELVNALSNDHPPANDVHRASIDDLPLRLKAAAVRGCIEIHGDGPEAINDMLLDLAHYPPEDWDQLTRQFEAQLSDRPPPDPGRTRVRFSSFALADGRRIEFDADIPVDRLAALRAAGHAVEMVGDAKSHRGMVRCCDCRHAKPTRHPAILECGEGVDSGNPIGGWWHTDEHICERFLRNCDPPGYTVQTNTSSS